MHISMNLPQKAQLLLPILDRKLGSAHLGV
jgi:hypothetical protein